MSKFPIPDGALAQHAIALGKTRSGKSAKLRLIVERLLDEKKPVCIIDPKGDWWGLKSSADGKKAGYAVIIFGGKHADIPINEHSGAHVAELVATGNRPCIIDLGGWRVGARTRFFIDFAEAFFIHARGTRWLAIDECHNFVPKGKVFSPDVGEMLHWGNRLASEGQGKGIILLSASQRPQKVHNDYLTSHETLIACRVVHKADRDAIKDWIDGCGDPVIGKEMIGALAAMKRPEAWVWSPEIGFGPERITFPLFSTYDSFKPQSADMPTSLKGWASVNLDEVKSKLATVVEEAAANDPKALKAALAAAQVELAKLRKSAGSPSQLVTKINTSDQRAIDRAIHQARAEGHSTGQRQGYDAGHRMGFDQGVKLARKAYLEAVQNVGSASILYAGAPAKPNLALVPTATASESKPVPSTARAAPAPFSRPLGGAEGLPAPQRRVLASIGFWASVGNDQPSRAQVAGVAGYSPSSGGFNNLLGQLNTAGLITIPGSGRVSLADGAPFDQLTAEEAKAKVFSVLSNPQRKLVDALVEVGGDPMARDELGSRTEYSPSSGGFNNLIGGLCTLTIFEKPSAGMVSLSAWAREVLA